MQKQLKIGLIGVGVVGSAVAKILQQNKDIITARTGVEIIIKKGIVKNVSKHKDAIIPLSDNADEVLYDNEIDVIVELMGGVEYAYNIAKIALSQHKAFVTANKAMLAYHRYELEQLAKTPIGFEASVCGGIPIIKALKEGLSANHILAIRGILNGTSNYILSKMCNEGWDFARALKQAQNLGYAEADPTLDINGTDAAHKLLILASLAYGIDSRPEEILIEGIENLAKEDIEFAREFGYTIKLLGIAKKRGEQIELRIHPVMLNSQMLLAKVDGVMNAISVVGDSVGESVYYGAGAGGEATASSVISDLIQIARGKITQENDENASQNMRENMRGNMLGFHISQPLSIIPKEQILSSYYVRILAIDTYGVLEKIASVLSRNHISISTFLQKPSDDGENFGEDFSENFGEDFAKADFDNQNVKNNKNQKAKILLSTHTTTESAIKNAIIELEALEVVLSKPIIIRIEEA
ncbi:homoserine dehydrogenase [Helicobacter sp. T3_23-1056]